MTDQAEQIDGYRTLTSDEISLVNEIKGLERRFGALRREVLQRGGHPRHAALAKTHGEDAFYRLVRAVTKPEDFYDDPPQT